jgi:hypothetical protein
MIFALMSLVLGPIAASAQKQIPTNEEVVISSVRAAVEEAMRGQGLDRIQMDMAKFGIDGPISNGIADALRSLGIQVFAGGANSVASNSLDYDLLGFDFDYRKGTSRGFFKKPMIRREFEARLRITVTESLKGSISSFEDVAVSYADDIDPRFANLVKSREIPELAPALPGWGWTKVVEPVVVTAAIGGIVYLFFANR